MVHCWVLTSGRACSGGISKPKQTKKNSIKKFKKKKNIYIYIYIYNKGLAISIKKYLKAKEELWILKYFTMQKNY
jgi:hypothetical protein